MLILCDAGNDVRERRGPAAADVRIASELNGWSPSDPRKGWAMLSQRSMTPPWAENKTQSEQNDNDGHNS